MKNLSIFLLGVIITLIPFTMPAQKKRSAGESMKPPDSLKNLPMPGLKFRSIGPAITGGRVVDFAVNPDDPSEYYVAVGHGSLWKTVNHGTTFEPVSDNQISHSIGVVEIDPSNPNVVWVGTGENDNQNNVIYGDGVYRSEDRGKSWNCMGLKASEHIGDIVIDPRDPDIVYIAAYGSSRNPGGERGIYKTADGGKTWDRVLYVSEYTGFYELHMDPRHSNILYAVAHQRMRNLYTSISGGPESAIYRSLDSGASWQKLANGLPSAHLGRMGMAISPANPDVLYAIVEAAEEAGFYRSGDRGSSWDKQSDYVSAYPFYFQKVVCDPLDENRVYSLDIFLQVSTDGGKIWSDLGEKFKHVDNHALWIDPKDNRHMLAGCDGGVYETYDMGSNWSFKDNIPITEIYKITADNDLPFYNVYIGTQDNNSLGGPSRTINSSGITNRDWVFTLSGDGFETQVDWQDPDIIYSQAQYGNLVRYDRKSGEKLLIKPFNDEDTSYRFDWDAALLISRHDPERLYFGGNRVFRTNDRGNTWKVISNDLTRGVPGEMQKLMGRSWSIDELARKGTMAQITTIAESPVNENVIFAGSGDGLIHFSSDGGESWRQPSAISGLPEYARIHQITASHFDEKIAYAACHNFTGGDYRPFVYRTEDGGSTWSSINGNLPGKGSTYSIAEDHQLRELLFVGTQSGVYYTVDGGKIWMPLKNGMPSIQVMDLEIQERENDLVVSTFGRGIYILDDYTPLRYLAEQNRQQEAMIFQVRDALMFIEASPFGFSGVGFQGADFYAAPNPEVGAAITFYLRDGYKSSREIRREAEKERQEKGEDVAYPPYEVLRQENDEVKPYLLFTITDEKGHIIRKIRYDDVSKGIHRIVWDFRYAPFTPVDLQGKDQSLPWDDPDLGYMVVPGKYFVSMQKFSNGKFTGLVSPQPFICKPLQLNGREPVMPESLAEFNRKVADLLRAISAADAYRTELIKKLPYLKQVVFDAPDIPGETYEQIVQIEKKMNLLNISLNGDPLRARYEGVAPTSIRERVDMVTGNLWQTLSAPTATFIRAYDIAADQFMEQLASLRELDKLVRELEGVLEKHGAAYTPGRFPEWER
jgi:photosystem II stability/assembly factor-like uncharacterized protein